MAGKITPAHLTPAVVIVGKNGLEFIKLLFGIIKTL